MYRIKPSINPSKDTHYFYYTAVILAMPMSWQVVWLSKHMIDIMGGVKKIKLICALACYCAG
jgi:hypothetical protein